MSQSLLRIGARVEINTQNQGLPGWSH
jgi:hypothetical protein